MTVIKATPEQLEWYRQLNAKIEHLDSAASLLAVNYDYLEPLRIKGHFTPQQAFDDLQSGLTGTSALPPISEPSGNGKAYAKFLAIYESMQAGAAVETVPSDAPAPEEVVTVDEDPEPLTQPL